MEEKEDLTTERLLLENTVEIQNQSPEVHIDQPIEKLTDQNQEQEDTQHNDAENFPQTDDYLEERPIQETDEVSEKSGDSRGGIIEQHSSSSNRSEKGSLEKDQYKISNLEENQSNNDLHTVPLCKEELVENSNMNQDKDHLIHEDQEADYRPTIDESTELKDEDLGIYMDDDMDSNISHTVQVLERENNPHPQLVPHGDDEASKKRSESRIQFQDPEKTDMEFEQVADQRAKVNTPVSHVTEPEARQLESREATYQQAMNLLTTRCTSTQQDLNQYSPEYFYIHQTKPTPMPPLKAWRGYHGNVYFEPITINRLQNTPQSPTRGSATQHCQNKNHQLLVTRSRMASRNSIKSRQLSSKSRPFTQQVVVLDRNTILNRLDEVSPEELALLEGQDSTGSLSLRPKTVGSCRRPVSSRFDKICKGSVSVQLRQSTQKREEPNIKIYGDKFVHPSALSPLLRSTTQYSLSNQWVQNSSPDLYKGHHSSLDNLPPVEQVRVSLRHIDNSVNRYGRTSPFTRSAKYTEELRPSIKYSPEVKARYRNRRVTGI